MAVKLPNRDVDILTCDRSAQVCNVKRLSWRGEEIASIPISNLREAEVEIRSNDKNDQLTYLLVLHTDSNRFPVTYNGTVSRKDSLAIRVNSFITNSQDTGFSEQVEQTHWGKWIFVAIVAGLGFKAVISKENSHRT